MRPLLGRLIFYSLCLTNTYDRLSQIAQLKITRRVCFPVNTISNSALYYEIYHNKSIMTLENHLLYVSVKSYFSCVCVYVSQAQGPSVPAGSAWRFPAAPHPAWLFSLWAPGPRCRAWTWSWWAPATACRWSRRDLPQVSLWTVTVFVSHTDWQCFLWWRIVLHHYFSNSLLSYF